MRFWVKVTGNLNWLETKIAFRTRAGRVVELNPHEITKDYGSEDEVVSLVARHPYVALGFRYLMRDLLQIAFAPKDAGEWASRLSAPPGPEEIEAAFAPYRRALVLDDPLYPAMQVRPNAQALEAARKPVKRVRRAAPEAEDNEEEGAGDSPVACLLPDTPTKNVTTKDDDFFTKRDPIEVVGAGAVLPLMYAHMVLFPPSGGGYFSLPHGADSLKFAVVGETLWASVYANVLPRNRPPYADVTWPVPCSDTVFPWLDASLASLSLKKESNGGSGQPRSRRVVRRVDLHPCVIPMARRYLLSQAHNAACDLTGVEGPAFSNYERWPNGLQYDAVAWWAPFAAQEKNYVWGCNGYAPKPRTRKAENGPAKETGPAFLKAGGPLRFDRWLGLSLANERPLPEKKLGATWSCVTHPPVVAAFQAAERLIPRVSGPEAKVSSLIRRSSFRLEAVAIVPEGKALGLLDARSLPLWLARDDSARVIGISVDRMLEALHAIADASQSHAKGAALVTDPKKSPTIAAQLRDALLATQDGALQDAAQKIYNIYAASDDLDAANNRTLQETAYFVDNVRKSALALFDATFPFADVGGAAKRVSMARAALSRDLKKIFSKYKPKTDTTVTRAERTRREK